MARVSAGQANPASLITSPPPTPCATLIYRRFPGGVHETAFQLFNFSAELLKIVVTFLGRAQTRAQGLGLAVHNCAPSSHPAVHNHVLPLDLAVHNRAPNFFIDQKAP